MIRLRRWTALPWNTTSPFSHFSSAAAEYCGEAGLQRYVPHHRLSESDPSPSSSFKSSSRLVSSVATGNYTEALESLLEEACTALHASGEGSLATSLRTKRNQCAAEYRSSIAAEENASAGAPKAASSEVPPPQANAWDVKPNSELEPRTPVILAKNAKELVEALTSLPYGSIHLLDDHFYVLDWYRPVQVRSGSDLCLVGGSRGTSVVIGALHLQKKTNLKVSNVAFFGPCEKVRLSSKTPKQPRDPLLLEEAPLPPVITMEMKPILNVTSKSHVEVSECSFWNGRDAVALSIGSTAKLNNNQFLQCLRGVYEGVGCCVDVASSSGNCFAHNYFHSVLLGPDKMKRYIPWAQHNLFRDVACGTAPRCSCDLHVCPPTIFVTSLFPLKRARADVVLSHDPISDVYEQCWRNGEELKSMTEEQKTLWLTSNM